MQSEETETLTRLGVILSRKRRAEPTLPGNLRPAIKYLTETGLGWENIYVLLKRHRIAGPQHRAVIRRYVLRLSEYSRRYGT